MSLRQRPLSGKFPGEPGQDSRVRGSRAQLRRAAPCHLTLLSESLIQRRGSHQPVGIISKTPTEVLQVCLPWRCALLGEAQLTLTSESREAESCGRNSGKII